VKPKVEELYMSHSSIKERMETLKAKSSDQVARLRANALFMFRSHPFGGIAMSKVNDPFARGDRILVQMNVFIVMLSMAVAFFYSKSLRCCEYVVVHYTCPEVKLAGDMSIDCMGYETCRAIMDAQGLMPEEIARPFSCTAFPQSTLIGRVWVIIIISCILVPVQMLYMSLFQMAGNAACAKAPTYFVQMRTQKKPLFDKGYTGMLQGFFFGLYAFFFNMEKFNKAIAMTLFAIIGRVAKVPNWFKTGLKRMMTLSASLTGGRTAATSVEKRRREIKPKPPAWVNEPRRRFVYAFVCIMWAVSVWVLLTYVTLIRAMEGKKAEQILLTTWGLTLFWEQFGKEGVKLLMVKSFVNWFSDKLEMIFASENKRNAWYDGHVMKAVAARNRLDNPDMDEEVDMDDEDFGDADGLTAGIDM